MNGYVERYMKQATVFFPIVGKPEQSYLVQLAHSIQDYFGETEITSTETIQQVFGPPQAVVKDYLAHSDAHHLMKRIRMRKYLRLCAISILSACLLAALFIAVHFGWSLYALHEVEGYDPPIYSADGTLLEE